MSDRVQRFDPETGNYILIEVATGEVLGEMPAKRQPGRPMISPFHDVDEIEPIEIERPRAVQTDPLEDYR